MSRSLRNWSIALLGAASFAAGCASVEQSSVIHNVDLQFRIHHEKQLERVATGAAPSRLRFDDRRFVLNGHRIVRGEGDVLAIRREDSGVPWRTDQASFRYLTIYFPKGQFRTDAPIRFGHRDGPLAFFSRGSLNMPGTNGCYGYGKRGTVTLHKLSGEVFRASLDLTVVLTSPLGFQSECGTEEIRWEADAREVGVAELKDAAH